MEPIIPRRKKVQNVYKDIHKLIAEPLIQRKKRDQSSSPVKYKDEPDFQSKRKFENVYKNKTTGEIPASYRKSRKNDNNLINEVQNNDNVNNFDARTKGFRKSKSSHNIGRSRRHTNKKNNANMPPAGCPTKNSHLGEYVLLDSKVPYRLKSPNFAMNNSAIQDLYRPVFANDSDYIVLKNNVPYHMKKHSKQNSKNSETGDWWINNNDYTDLSTLEIPEKDISILNSDEVQKNVENLPKYRRSRSHGDFNHQRRLYKDERHRTNQDLIRTANNQIALNSKNHSTQTEIMNQHKNYNNKSHGLDNNFDKNLKSPPKINLGTATVNNKSSKPNVKNSYKNEINNNKNIMVTKSDIANFVMQKHEEQKKRIKNPEIQPTFVKENNKAIQKSNTNLNDNKKNIPAKVYQLSNHSKNDIKENNIDSNQNLTNHVRPAKAGKNLNQKPIASTNVLSIKNGAYSLTGNPQRLSEYQRQFQWLSNYNVAPIIKAHNYLHTSQPNLLQLNKVGGKSRDYQLVKLLKSENGNQRIHRSQSAGPTHSNYSDKGYHSGSEYATNFNEPSQYNYYDGLWNKKPIVTARVRGQEKDVSESQTSTWYDQVIELRRRAEEYRSRAQGVNFSNNHLAQLMSRNLQLWDAASRSTATSNMPSASNTHRSNTILTARNNSYSTREPTDRSNVGESSQNYNNNAGQVNSPHHSSRNEVGQITSATQNTLKNSGALANDVLLRAQTRSDNFWSGT